MGNLYSSYNNNNNSEEMLISNNSAFIPYKKKVLNNINIEWYKICDRFNLDYEKSLTKEDISNLNSQEIMDLENCLYNYHKKLCNFHNSIEYFKFNNNCMVAYADTKFLGCFEDLNEVEWECIGTSIFKIYVKDLSTQEEYFI
jgi:hypothetical protein